MYKGELQSPPLQHKKADSLEVMRQITAAQERLRKSCRVLIGSLAVGATVVLAPSTVIGADIENTKEALSHTQPIIHDIAEARDSSSSSINFFADGFATTDGSWNAGFQTSTIQDIDPGSVSAVEYDNDGIDVGTIASAIADTVAVPVLHDAADAAVVDFQSFLIRAVGMGNEHVQLVGNIHSEYGRDEDG
jgi:hypothetical protein